jgi:hypothetical protein
MNIPKPVKELYNTIWNFLIEKTQIPAKKDGKIYFNAIILKKKINNIDYLSIKISRADIYKLISKEYKLDPSALSSIINDIEEIEILIEKEGWLNGGEYSLKATSNDNTIHYHYWYQMNLDHTDVLELHNIVNMRIDVPEKPTIKEHILESSVKGMSDEKYSRLVYQVFTFIRKLLIDLMISFVNIHI